MVLEGRASEVAGFAGKLTGIRNNEQREEGVRFRVGQHIFFLI